MYLKGSLNEGMTREATYYVLHTEGSNRLSEMCILYLFRWQLHIHGYHLVLMVDIGSFVQQSLDCLGVSILSSYLQRNSAILYESMREAREHVIVGGDHCCRTEEL